MANVQKKIAKLQSKVDTLRGKAPPSVVAAVSPQPEGGSAPSAAAEAKPSWDFVPVIVAVGAFFLAWLVLGWRWWIAAIVAVVLFALVRWFRNRGT